MKAAAKTLCDRVYLTTTMVADTDKYFNEMSATIPKADREQWERSISFAEANRLSNLALMDILGAGVADRSPNIPTISTTGSTDEEKWIDLALAIEEMQ
jgi:hypothetical protein